MQKTIFVGMLALALTILAPSPLLAENNSSDSIKALSLSDDSKAKFALFLSSLIQRWGYEKPVETLPPSIMLTAADVFSQTSIRQRITRDGVTYELLYSWIADTFFLIEMDGYNIKSFGATSGKYIADAGFKQKEEGSYFHLILLKRPALFKAVVSEFGKMPDPQKVFSRFLVDELESQTLQENLQSAMKLIEWGSKDPCRTYSTVYLRRNPPTFSGGKKLDKTEFYPSIGLNADEGRILAFSDEKTNRYFGILVFDKDDLRECKPKAVYTSEY